MLSSLKPWMGTESDALTARSFGRLLSRLEFLPASNSFAFRTYRPSSFYWRGDIFSG